MHMIPELNREECEHADCTFQEVMKKHMLEQKYYKDYADKYKIERIEEALEFKVPGDMILQLYRYIEGKDDFRLYEITQKSLEETQSQMEYYKTNEDTFPNLEKISLHFSKNDYRFCTPWSNVIIRIMNNIATNNNKEHFDYNNVVEFAEKQFE